MKIEIDGSPYATDYYYRGNYYKNEIEFSFEIIDRDMEDIIINWVDEIPKDNLNVEQEIIKQYQER